MIQVNAAARAACFRAAGYVPVGLDHFARPDDPLAAALRGGRLRRNFQGYTTDRAPALLGLGASAIGRLPQGHVQNHAAEHAVAAAFDAYLEADTEARHARAI